jgi:hypothetical protein
VLRPGGRIAVMGMSKEQGHGVIFHLYEWTHEHSPNFVDCRPIFVARALEEAGFRVEGQEHREIWVPLLLLGADPLDDRGGGDPVAVGARLLARKEAIVSRLVAIEGLAGMDLLCSDKTGTLTQNRLTLGEPSALPGTSAAEVITSAALASRAEDQDLRREAFAPWAWPAPTGTGRGASWACCPCTTRRARTPSPPSWGSASSTSTGTRSRP